jgi:hypothetical protein
LEFETKLTEFQHFVIGLRQRNKYSLSQICNADETAVFSTCTEIIPHISRGKTHGNENHRLQKLHITVTLHITTNGNTLPLYVILNRKTVPKVNAWMTSELMED